MAEHVRRRGARSPRHDRERRPAARDAPADVKLLNDVFRPFHTVKGNAGALGVTSVQEFAHSVENLLDLARSGRHAMGPDEFDIVLSAVDLLTIMMHELPVAWRPASRPR